MPFKIKSDKYLFLKTEFSDKSTVKILSEDQLREAKVTDERL